MVAEVPCNNHAEEANVNDILAPLRMMGEDKGGLMMVDQQLAQRLPPTPLAPAN